jgi:hypothetical protein
MPTLSSAGRIRLCVSVLLGGACAAWAQDPSLIGYWSMNEGTGTTVADMSVYGNRGTLSGANWGFGYSGTGLWFDGTDDGVTIPHQPSLDATTGLTICAWIRGSSYLQQYEEVVFKRYSYWLGLANKRLYAGVVTTHGLGTTTGFTMLTPLTWTFVALTYDSRLGGYPTNLLDCDGFQPMPNGALIPDGGPNDWDQELREIGNFLYDPNDPDPQRLYKFTYSAYVLPYYEDQVWVGAAFSPDGVTWTKYGPPIISRASEDPYVVLVDGGYYLYCEDKGAVPFRNIRRFRSSDFVNWTDDGVVFDIQPGGDPPGWQWGDVSSPLVWIENGTWYLLYEGRGGGYLGRIGLATSSDGLSWTRVGDDPVLTEPVGGWDDTAQVPDDLMRVGDQYCLTFHGCNTNNPVGFWAGLAYSTDLVHWTASPANPVNAYDTMMLLQQGNNTYGFSQMYRVGVQRFQAWKMSAPKLYINGLPEVMAPKKDLANGTINVMNTPVSIGEQIDTPHYDFFGAIDEVRMYNRALTGDEILGLIGPPPGPPPMIGDVNCDGSINFGDINPFVLVMTNLPGWLAAYPGCPLSNADINQDSTVDFADINPFVTLLSYTVTGRGG